MESASPLCNICSIELSKEGHYYSNLCSDCTEFYLNALPHYTEAFACAAQQSHDAVRLLILRQRIDNFHERIADADSYDGDLWMHEANLEVQRLSQKAAEVMQRLPASFAPWWKEMWTQTDWCKVYEARKEVRWLLPSANTPILQRLAAMFAAEQHKTCELKKKIRLEANEHQVMLAKVRKEAMEAQQQEAALVTRLKREMAEKDKRYMEALDPLLGVRDKVRAECEKKCHDAERKGYAAGYAFADQKWNPVYKAVCEELEAVRKGLRDEEEGATTIFQGMRSDLERLSAENKALKEKHDALLELVGPTQKLMASNPELFGGEVKGTSSPRPPAIVMQWRPVSEEETERAEKFLKALEANEAVVGKRVTDNLLRKHIKPLFVGKA